MDKCNRNVWNASDCFRPSCMNRVSVFFLWHKRFKEGREYVRDYEMCGKVRKLIQQNSFAQAWGLGLGLLCWGFKGVHEEIRPEEASTLQIWSEAFTAGQYSSPQLNPCHRLFDRHQIVPHPPYSLDLAPCDFWLFPKLRGCLLWDNWRDERSCDEGLWHTHTRRLPWGLQDVFGRTQVHCIRRRLLRRGLEFHVYTINKSAHTKKVWELILFPSCIEKVDL